MLWALNVLPVSKLRGKGFGKLSRLSPSFSGGHVARPCISSSPSTLTGHHFSCPVASHAPHFFVGLNFGRTPTWVVYLYSGPVAPGAMASKKVPSNQMRVSKLRLDGFWAQTRCGKG